MKITWDLLAATARDLTQSPFFQVFLLLIFFDILSGYAKAIKHKKLDSKTSTAGLLKHSLVIGLVFCFDVYARSLGQIAFSIGMTSFYIATYGFSLLENLEAIGVPFPSWLRAIFKQMRDRQPIKEEK